MSNPIKFTVGMAMFDEERGGVHPESLRAIFTGMSALIHHSSLVNQFLIIDNNPLPDNTLKNFFAKTTRAKYIAMPDPQGTSPPRNRVFEEADNEHVACIDGHVLLYPGFFESLASFYDTHGHDCPDLLHGPMMTESSQVMATHMNDQWRSEMWGTWGRMWITPDGRMFSCLNPDANQIAFVTFDEYGNSIPMEGSNPFPVPPSSRIRGWAGHEPELIRQGCRTVDDQPFPIPGHGMGFFACRKDSWLPFHPNCRGFGGEEMTTGVRFRMAGRTCWCVPGAKWWHHFERPWTQTRGATGAPYRVALYDRIRNYVLEFQRLGLDLQPIYNHFKYSARSMPDSEWNQIIQGKEWPDQGPDVAPHTYKPKVKPSTGGCAQTGETNPEVRKRGLSTLYEQSLGRKSPIRDDMHVLRTLASRCSEEDRPGKVVEIGTNHGFGTVALLMGEPRRLFTYAPNSSQMADQLTSFVQEDKEYQALLCPDTTRLDIPECDFLFLNPEPHTAQRIGTELARHSKKVSRFIAIHGTTAYGEKYNNEPGVLPAIRGFLYQNPEWKVVAKYDTESGLVVLSKNLKDVPATPIQLGKGGVKQHIPDFGPGTELMKIMDSLDIQPHDGCDCKGKAAQMNLWASKGCRTNLNTIVGWLKDNQDKWGWTEKLRAAALAVKTGLAGKINWLDPFPGIVEEAIRRAEENESK